MTSIFKSVYEWLWPQPQCALEVYLNVTGKGFVDCDDAVTKYIGVLFDHGSFNRVQHDTLVKFYTILDKHDKENNSDLLTFLILALIKNNRIIEMLTTDNVKKFFDLCFEKHETIKYSMPIFMTYTNTICEDYPEVLGLPLGEAFKRIFNSKLDTHKLMNTPEEVAFVLQTVETMNCRF